jgi:hypothetical protein
MAFGCDVSAGDVEEFSFLEADLALLTRALVVDAELSGCFGVFGGVSRVPRLATAL